MGNSTREAAIALVVAGVAAALGLLAGVVGLRAAERAAIQTLSTLGLLMSGAAGVVTLVFAVAFHW